MLRTIWAASGKSITIKSKKFNKEACFIKAIRCLTGKIKSGPSMLIDGVPKGKGIRGV